MAVLVKVADAWFKFDQDDAPLFYSRSWSVWNGYLTSNHPSEKFHRLVLGLQKGDGRRVDHIDLNIQNNCKSNLRVCTHQQNNCNKARLCTNTSGYKGVSYHKLRQKWVAQIGVHKRHVHLGLFLTKELAHEAYVAAAKHLHGKFASF